MDKAIDILERAEKNKAVNTAGYLLGTSEVERKTHIGFAQEVKDKLVELIEKLGTEEFGRLLMLTPEQRFVLHLMVKEKSAIRLKSATAFQSLSGHDFVSVQFDYERRVRKGYTEGVLEELMLVNELRPTLIDDKISLVQTHKLEQRFSPMSTIVEGSYYRRDGESGYAKQLMFFYFSGSPRSIDDLNKMGGYLSARILESKVNFSESKIIFEGITEGNRVKFVHRFQLRKVGSIKSDYFGNLTVFGENEAMSMHEAIEGNR